MDVRFEARMQSVRDKFAVLTSMEPTNVHRANPDVPDAAGVYVFWESGHALYVGRTRCLRRRVRTHVDVRALDAPFAFRLAQEACDCPPTYRKRGGRKELLARDDFREALVEAKERIRRMALTVVEEDDPVAQVVLEIYAADALRVPHNDFKTT